jgi:hypothetical protein
MDVGRLIELNMIHRLRDDMIQYDTDARHCVSASAISDETSRYPCTE